MEADNRIFALLIGVDDYPGTATGFFCSSLNGCVRDVARVENYLIERQKVPPERITKLTASNPANGPVPADEVKPTYLNIVAAFLAMMERAQKGDQLFIHYSGHGARVDSIFDKPGNEKDEALVPHDVKQGGRLLRDVELAYLLDAMAQRGLLVTLSLDSCHSGGATRDGADAQARLAEMKTGADGSAVASMEQLKSVWQKTASAWSQGTRPHILLAACRSVESAYEQRINDEKVGLFTHYLIETLTASVLPLTYRQLFQQLVGTVHGTQRLQTPIFEGDGQRLFLGGEGEAPPQAIMVTGLDASNRVCLEAGRVQGLVIGAQLLVHRTGKLSPDGVGATLVETVNVDATRSLAKVLTQGESPVQAGDVAELVKANLPNVRPVALATIEKDVIRDSTSAGQIRAKIEADPSGLLRLAADGEVGSFLLRQEGDEILLCDGATQAPLPAMSALASTDSNLAAKILDRLLRVSRFKNLELLSNNQPNKVIFSGFKVELYPAPEDYQDGDQPVIAGAPLGDSADIVEGSWLFLRIANGDSRDVNVAVLDLQPDWGISQQYPGVGYETLGRGEERVIPFRFDLPNNLAPGSDVLKVFATVDTTDYGWLLQPAIDQRDSTTRGGLGDTLAMTLGYAPPRTRNSAAGAVATQNDWSTRQVVIRVLKKEKA